MVPCLVTLAPTSTTTTDAADLNQASLLRGQARQSNRTNLTSVSPTEISKPPRIANPHREEGGERRGTRNKDKKAREKLQKEAKPREMGSST